MSDEEQQNRERYLQTRLDELTGQTIKSDAVISRVTRELRQRRQGFALLSELHRNITTDLPAAEVYARLLDAVQRSLKMDRSVVLKRDSDSDAFRPESWIGMNDAPPSTFDADAALQRADGFVLATKNAALTPFISQVRDVLGIAFFVAVPIVASDRITGILISGRQREMKPFFPPLDEQDVHTMSALAGFLGSAITNAGLFETQRKMADSFRRFVPQQFLEILGKKSILEIGMGEQVQRTMSILFSDIRSFTTISEQMTPKANFDFINRYLEFVGPAVIENGGFIDKYIGDAIMALFPGDADSAVRGAIGLHTGLARFNEEWTQHGNKPIQIGAGMHTGALMLGTVGFKERMDTTVIADAVNLASRMEGLTKQYGAGVLITGATRAAMHRPGEVAMRTVDRVLVKGKNEPVEIVEVFEADPPHLRVRKADSLAAFQLAMEAYTHGDFAAASAGFGELLGDDNAAMLLNQRCQKFLREGTPSDWRGVVAMEK